MKGKKFQHAPRAYIFAIPPQPHGRHFLTFMYKKLEKAIHLEEKNINLV